MENGQKNNYLQHTMQKTNDRATRTLPKGEFRCSRRVTLAKHSVVSNEYKMTGLRLRQTEHIRGSLMIPYNLRMNSNSSNIG